jgi:hypothetical protein
MRRALRILAPVVAVMATLVPLTANAAATPHDYSSYVALGDSYATAEGTTSIDPNDSCQRGPASYPRQWSAAHPGTAFTDETCSGAVISDVTNQAAAGLNASTSLVTVQVGGNDVDFVPVMVDCVITPSDSSCENAAANAAAKAQQILPGELGTLYAGIKAEAPSAKVVVVGYPRMYAIGGNCILGLSDAERTALNNAADVLDDTIQQAAANAGFTFLDARTTYSGHEICSAGPVWLNSVNWGDLDASYHPNQAGHDGYEAALVGITG